MTEKPLALRLAERLTDGWWSIENTLLPAAAELRRQHAEIESLRARYRWLRARLSVEDIERLAATDFGGQEWVAESAKTDAAIDEVLAKHCV